MDIVYESELCHHGIKGQRWGVRRYQNADGSYTKAGILRYANNRTLNRIDRKFYTQKGKEKAVKKLKKYAEAEAELEKIGVQNWNDFVKDVAALNLKDYADDWRWDYPGDYYDDGRKNVADHKAKTISDLQRGREESRRMATGWTNVVKELKDVNINDIEYGTDLIDMIDRAFPPKNEKRKGGG